MLLYPLILGILSMLSPFLGLILLFTYLARTVVNSLAKPLQAITMFLVMPVVMLFVDTSVSTRIMALDAIFGVGIAALVYLVLLKRNHVLSDAFMIAFIVVAGYGIMRFQLFAAYQAELFEQGINLLREQIPAWADNAMLESTLPIWKAVLPAVWIFSQGLALLIGFLFFQKILKVPNAMQNMRFPGIYNLLIVAIIPLYLFENTKLLFLNALISLCMIPLLQGISIMWNRLSMIFANRILVSMLLIILTLYANILLILIGFADMWLTNRNLSPGGNTA